MTGLKYIIDSRSLTDPCGTVFVAIETPSNDGHKFIPELIAKGVRSFIVSRDVSIPQDINSEEINFIKADNTLDELRVEAQEKLSRLGTPVIAITGSRGKTIVKEWLDILLDGKTNRSPRSFNSQIGVPLSVLNMPENTFPVIIEAGISKPGEMIRHQHLLKPNIVVITNVTDEHDEGFENREQKIKEKMILAEQAEYIVYPGDDCAIVRAIEELKRKNSRLETIEWKIEGNEGIIVHAAQDGSDCSCSKILLDKLGLENNFLHSYDYSNFMTAIATCEALKDYDIRVNWSKVLSLPRLVTRLSFLEGRNNSKIIVDKFRSDVISMAQAFDIVRRSSSRKKWFIVNNLVEEPFKIKPEEIKSLVDEALAYGFEHNIVLEDKKESVEAIVRNDNVSCFCNLNDFFKYKDCNGEEGATYFIHSPQDNWVLETLLGNFEARLHETTLEINLDALGHNFNYFKSMLKPSTGIVCMLKAFGYGTGSVEIAKTLEAKGVSAVAVAVIDEGIELRDKGVKCPIIVLNPHAHNMDAMFEKRLEPVIYNFGLLDEIAVALKKRGEHSYPVHLKIETGMRRLGFMDTEISALVTRIRNIKEYIKVDSMFSHLATADCPDMDDYTVGQIELFKECAQHIENGLGYVCKKHILNTAGIIRFPEYQMDMVRLGIGLYGVATLPEPLEEGLQPVASLYSTIISLKKWKKGDSIGYGGKNTLSHDSLVATVPIGYADGLDRRFGNGKASMMVKGVPCPTVGNICMDICMIDVTNVPECTVGTKVELFGRNIDIQRLADTLGTIPYEILTSVSQRVKRVYFYE